MLKKVLTEHTKNTKFFLAYNILPNWAVCYMLNDKSTKLYELCERLFAQASGGNNFMENLTEYLSGSRLFGDDFNLKQIEEWYKDEEEGYANLGAKDKSLYRYGYHALNLAHGLKYIKKRSFNNALGLGSAYGDEFLPIIKNIKKLTIIDPSDSFCSSQINSVPCEYKKPSIDGKIPSKDKSFDLIICLGVLHHIPNVTTVVKELYRCLTDDGVILLREPIVSMGDWSKPRRGLTKRERGIPLKIFREIIINAGFNIKREALCVFPLLSKICHYLGISPYNSKIVTWLDAKLSKLFSKNLRYHAAKFTHKFRPSAVYFVLDKKND